MIDITLEQIKNRIEQLHKEIAANVEKMEGVSHEEYKLLLAINQPLHMEVVALLEAVLEGPIRK
ncbi:hypothetical protein [Aneurinibacillus tyrosinisolvens]|uniref:hypothetical protein n=1 Tax=Aneurinibacillus tyrosinisolvens TaxID=1443435 RepID=UPI00063F962E|nr:hypothetical protein [Aneurinibacillus tyrosinisolvens]